MIEIASVSKVKYHKEIASALFVYESVYEPIWFMQGWAQFNTLMH